MIAAVCAVCSDLRCLVRRAGPRPAPFLPGSNVPGSRESKSWESGHRGLLLIVTSFVLGRRHIANRLQLLPDFPWAVHLVIGVPDALDVRPSPSSRCARAPAGGRIRALLLVAV